MRYSFVTIDVFTERRFCGNQLAVFPEAKGLSGEQMQALAGEFGYAESTFVLPAKEQGNDAQVRIFTPVKELGFAGHPNIGTAAVLHGLGRVGDEVQFEEGAGLVPLKREEDGSWFLDAPQALQRFGQVEKDLAARSIGLEVEDVCEELFAPAVASTGNPFLFVEVATEEALLRAEPEVSLHREFEGYLGVYVFLRKATEEGHAVRTRMFAPAAGVYEDAATGSAALTLGGLLAEATGIAETVIQQGLEMGRPSTLVTRQVLEEGKAVRCSVGGKSVVMFEGSVEV
ncbi:MAG: PhzF family phenazine biosynthesis protein [Verrucomicrobiota bacterium]